jgi:two-component system OmpR family response regulator
MLLERVSDFQFDPKTSVVDTRISRLGAKIDKPFGQPWCTTVRNIGYGLRAAR